MINRIHCTRKTVIAISAGCLLYWWPNLLVPDTLSTSRMVMFIFIGCMVLAGYLLNANKWLAFSFISLAISVSYNVLNNRTVLLRGSLYGDPVATINLSPVLGLTVVAMGLLIVLWSFHHGNGRSLAKIIAGIGGLGGIVSVLQYCGIEWPFYSLYAGNSMSLGAPPSFFGNPGIAGGTFSLILPLAIWSFPIMVPAIVAGVLLSKSTIGFIAMVIAAIYYFAFNFKSVATILGLLILVSAFAYYADSHRFSDIPRLRIWKATAWLWPRSLRGKFDGNQNLKVDTKSIIFGHGLRMFRARFPIWDYRIFGIGVIREKHENERVARDVIGDGKHRKLVSKDVSVGGTTWNHSHNEFIQTLFEAGLIVILPLIGLLSYVFRRLFSGLRGENRAWATVVLAGLVFALWSFPFHSVPSATIFAVSLGQFLRGGGI